MGRAAAGRRRRAGHGAGARPPRARARGRRGPGKRRGRSRPASTSARSRRAAARSAGRGRVRGSASATCRRGRRSWRWRCAGTATRAGHAGRRRGGSDPARPGAGRVRRRGAAARRARRRAARRALRAGRRTRRWARGCSPCACGTRRSLPSPALLARVRAAGGVCRRRRAGGRPGDVGEHRPRGWPSRCCRRCCSGRRGCCAAPTRPRWRVLLAVLGAAAALFARWCRRRWPAGRGRALGLRRAAGRARWCRAWLATSPLMVVSDAVFHANNLARVAGGRPLLTSVTQHAPPVPLSRTASRSTLLLAPLLRAGLDGVALVRVGRRGWRGGGLGRPLPPAAAPRRRRAARGLAVVLLQLLPVTLDVHSLRQPVERVRPGADHGLLRLVGRPARPGGWAGGRAAARPWEPSATSRASSCSRRSPPRSWARAARRGMRGRRALAAVVGLVLAAGVLLRVRAARRWSSSRALLEGGGQGAARRAARWTRCGCRSWAPLAQWGLPALVLAWVGQPRRARGGGRWTATSRPSGWRERRWRCWPWSHRWRCATSTR